MYPLLILKLKAIRLRVKGNFNSLRVQTDIRYQRAFHVPTKTTLIGLLGAAIGLDESEIEQLYSLIQTNAFLQRYSGTANDLWLITKIKLDALNKPESSLVTREMLFEPNYTIYYIIDSNPEVEKDIEYNDIISAFNDPEFPLTLGRSDEMIEISDKPKTIELTSPHSDAVHYSKNTVLPFNYKDHFGGYEKVRIQKGYAFNLPQVLTVPTSFKISKEGIRRPSSYQQVTLVYDTAVKIVNRIDGLVDDEDQRYIYVY